MKKLVLMAALVTGMSGVRAQTTWTLDPSHTRVGFTVSHMMVSDVDGNFKTSNGQIVSSKDDFSDAVIDFSIDVGSINTDNETRDKHLKSDDFFNAEQFPKMIFKSTSFKRIAGNKYKLSGNLTIRDITKPVSFDVTYNGTAVSPWKTTVAGFKLTGSINRFDYNLKWATKMDNGNLVAGEQVNIIANVEFIKK